MLQVGVSEVGPLKVGLREICEAKHGSSQLRGFQI
jgi:hypothetical protein